MREVRTGCNIFGFRYEIEDVSAPGSSPFVRCACNFVARSLGIGAKTIPRKYTKELKIRFVREAMDTKRKLKQRSKCQSSAAI